MEILTRYWHFIIPKTSVLGFCCYLLVTLTIPFSSFGQQERKKEWVIVLDAGHGGKDPGKLGSGKHGTHEKHIALDVVLKLGNYIDSLIPNSKVIYTRKTDVFVELHERTKIANKAKADVFISVHCNAAESHQAHGAETWVMGVHKTQSNLKVAMEENESILMEKNYEQKYEGFDPKQPETMITLALRQNIYLEQSLKLSDKIQEQFEKRVGRRNRGIKQAGFVVISYTTMPSVLIELGFLTNNTEEEFLNSEKGKDYMASAIYRALRDYINDVKNSSDIKKIQVNDQDSVKTNPQIQKEEEVSLDNTITFRVQFKSSAKKINLSSNTFKGLVDLVEYRDAGMYKYTCGSFTSFQEAMTHRSSIKQRGFSDAFVIAFQNGKRISTAKARQISGNNQR